MGLNDIKIERNWHQAFDYLYKLYEIQVNTRSSASKSKFRKEFIYPRVSAVLTSYSPKTHIYLPQTLTVP